MDPVTGRLVPAGVALETQSSGGGGVHDRGSTSPSPSMPSIVRQALATAPTGEKALFFPSR